MKFFIDTANLDQIKEAQELGILDGVTTNPSLMAKEGITGEKNIIDHYLKICEIVDGDVSAEVISVESDFVTVSAGLKSESVIKTEEFLDDKGTIEVSLGDHVKVAIEKKLADFDNISIEGLIEHRQKRLLSYGEFEG